MSAEHEAATVRAVGAGDALVQGARAFERAHSANKTAHRRAQGARPAVGVRRAACVETVTCVAALASADPVLAIAISDAARATHGCLAAADPRVVAVAEWHGGAIFVVGARAEFTAS